MAKKKISKVAVALVAAVGLYTLERSLSMENNYMVDINNDEKNDRVVEIGYEISGHKLFSRYEVYINKDNDFVRDKNISKKDISVKLNK